MKQWTGEIHRNEICNQNVQCPSDHDIKDRRDCKDYSDKHEGRVRISTFAVAGLDPFYKLPIQVSVEERRLFHYYNLTVASLAWGIRLDALPDFTSGTVSTWMQLYPLSAQWIMIASETHLALRSSRLLPKTVLSRRAKAYGALNQAIQDPKRLYTDDTMTGLITAALIEGRFGDLDDARKHLRGLEALVTLRGGWRTLLRHTRSWLYLNLSCDSGFHNRDEEKMAKLAMSQVMSSSCQRDRRSLRSPFQNSKHGHESALCLVEIISMLQVLTSDCVLAVTHDSHTIKDTTRECLREARIRFTLCWAIYLMLLHFEGKPELGQQYFTRLKQLMNRSTARDENQRPLLSAQGMLYLMVKVFFDIYAFNHDAREAYIQEAWFCTSCVNALKVYSLLELSRQQVLSLRLFERLRSLASIRPGTTARVTDIESVFNPSSNLQTSVSG